MFLFFRRGREPRANGKISESEAILNFHRNFQSLNLLFFYLRYINQISHIRIDEPENSTKNGHKNSLILRRILSYSKFLMNII